MEREQVVNKLLATITLTGLSTLALGCQSNPATPTSKVLMDHSIDSSRVAMRETIRLGAGDTLGREVFEQAVTVARAESGRIWLASANSRALLPAFTSRQIKAAPVAENDAMWAMLVEPAGSCRAADDLECLLGP